jgi:hypothetical protein
MLSAASPCSRPYHAAAARVGVCTHHLLLSKDASLLHSTGGGMHRLDKVKQTMTVTWLKPETMEEWWRQRWQPWMLQAGRGKHGRSQPWLTHGIEMDTVQVLLLWTCLIRKHALSRAPDNRNIRPLCLQAM